MEGENLLNNLFFVPIDFGGGEEEKMPLFNLFMTKEDKRMESLLKYKVPLYIKEFELNLVFKKKILKDLLSIYYRIPEHDCRVRFLIFCSKFLHFRTVSRKKTWTVSEVMKKKKKYHWKDYKKYQILCDNMALFMEDISNNYFMYVDANKRRKLDTKESRYSFKDLIAIFEDWLPQKNYLELVHGLSDISRSYNFFATLFLKTFLRSLVVHDKYNHHACIILIKRLE